MSTFSLTCFDLLEPGSRVSEMVGLCDELQYPFHSAISSSSITFRSNILDLSITPVPIPVVLIPQHSFHLRFSALLVNLSLTVVVLARCD